MIIIHDKRLPLEYKEALKARLPSVQLYPFDGPDRVYESISCHPDIYFFQLDDNTLIHSPDLPDGKIEILRKSGAHLIKGRSEPFGLYPHTVKYNAVRIGKVLIHNLEYTDRMILKKARENGIKAVNAAQGYARCSVLKISEAALVTSDASIATAAVPEGLDVLQVLPGSVLLSGEKYGFLGGAGGKLPDGRVLILGDIGRHPQADMITDFMREHGVKYIDLPGLPLYDAGGLLIFP
ncbi:MAG: DUF6873 family GME fold protein [Candidatus Omnitrophota bacterium]